MIDKTTPIIVQGITGKQGRFHTNAMIEYGTNIVAGVTPGKDGESVIGVPVYDSVKEAVAKNPAKWSVLFVPAANVKKAAIDALNEDLNIIIISEGVPVHDSLTIIKEATKRNKLVIGPNCPGIVVADVAKIGIMPGHIFKKGDVGIVSRSGTLTYEIVELLSSNNIGQSTVIGIGGDPIIGFNHIEALTWFENDPHTKKIILIGEIGGDLEERAAQHIKSTITKKVVGFIAGQHAPPGKQMGHAGAIISGNSGTAKSKIDALEEAGVKVAKKPSDILKLLK